MGVFSHESKYSSKFLNAEITDAASRIHIMPIKYVLGDYFLAEIDRQIYAFRIEGSRIKTWHARQPGTIRKVYYDTTHYMPISGPDYTEIERVLKENSLPKMNRILFNILYYLGKRERFPFVPHDFAILSEDVKSMKNVYKVDVQNMLNYLKHLDIKQVVTPVKRITEFFHEDMIPTDSKFLGDTLMQALITDREHRVVTNKPVRAKMPWLKVTIIGLIATAALVGIWWAVDSGAFNNIGAGFGLQGFGGVDTNSIAKQYPTPESLRIAIDQGKVDEGSLPKEIKDWLKSYVPPTVTPKSSTVEITP